MRVWIDLSNSPHPRLFAPIAELLDARGDEVLITVRDHAQTVPLALERWPGAEVVGGRTGRGTRFTRGRELASRAAALTAWARAARPDVALSHNSYGQLVAARRLNVPSVTAMDFEHQPANHLAFRLARRVLLPEIVPERKIRRQGAGPDKTVRYPGLKEELYLGAARPDPGVLEQLGIARDAGSAVVVARTDPAGAAYHAGENPLLLECVRAFGERGGTTCVVLARHEWQRQALERAQVPRCVIPGRVVDADALLFETDLFLGGGGTMTREAALLGVPTYSAFAGRRPAVDRWLESEGRLRRVDSVADLPAVVHGERAPPELAPLRERGRAIAEVFVRTVSELGSEGSGR